MNKKILDPNTLAKHPNLEKIAERIGDTPLIELSVSGAQVFAKCEWTNPTGTIKDRAAFAMLHDFLKNHRSENKTVLEYSGGSLGFALSHMCHELGIPLRLVLSSFFDKKVAAHLEEQGTKIEWVDKEKGFWAVMEKARAMAESDPGYAFLYQHGNPANAWIHEVTTGEEIIHQLNGRKADAWVASIGTGATLMGVYYALKKNNPAVQVYATTPSELPYASHLPPNGLPKFAGSGGLGDGRKQPLVEKDEAVISGHYTYSYEECLKAMAQFFKLTGMSIGSSAAANWLAANAIAKKLGPGKTVVTVFPSRATEFEREKVQTYAAVL
jgi:cysteine synthase A